MSVVKVRTRNDLSEEAVYEYIRDAYRHPMSDIHMTGCFISMIVSGLDTTVSKVRRHLKNLEALGIVRQVSYQDSCTCYEFCECEATNLVYKTWMFVKDYDKYSELNQRYDQMYAKVSESLTRFYEESLL